MAVTEKPGLPFTVEVLSFRTVNTSSNAVTMKDDELDLLINYMPVGNSLYSLPGISSALVSIGNSEIARANATVYVVNQIVRPATPNGFIYKCTAGGTSAGSPPTWPLINGNTVSDGGVTWQAVDCTIQRMFDVNVNNVLYKLVSCVGGMMYRIDSTWGQIRLTLPSTFTNPKFDQWQYLVAVIVDPSTGYFYFSNIYSPTFSAALAQATTTTKVKTSNWVEFTIGNNKYSKVASDNFWTLTGFNCTQNNYNSCYLYVDSSGSATAVSGAQSISGVESGPNTR